MKSGRTLNELAIELDRQARSKKDYLADTRVLQVRPDLKGGVVLDGVNGGMPLRPTAHAQMGQALGIPKPYYDRMLQEAPDLLAANCNRWLERNPARKLIRTLDGQVRAILSDSYRPLDNTDLAEAVLPTLGRLEATVISCEVTESRMYLKAVTERVSGAVKLDDIVQAGIVVANSEVGHGALSIEALDFRLVCLNGMIRERAVRKAHLGRRSGNGGDAIEDAREFFKDETRLADDRAFFLKARDGVGAMFDPKRFEARLFQYQEAAGKKVEGDPAKAVEVLAKRIDLTDGERSSVLAHLIEGGDLTAWGFANAVTRASQDADDYDRATEMERLGGLVLELPQAEWKALAR